MSHRAKFVTSIPNDSITATDNIYVDNTECGNRMWQFSDNCSDKLGLIQQENYELFTAKYTLFTF